MAPLYCLSAYTLEGHPDAHINVLLPGLNLGCVDLAAAQIGPWGLRVPQVEIMLPLFSLRSWAIGLSLNEVQLGKTSRAEVSRVSFQVRGVQERLSHLDPSPGMEIYQQSLLSFCWRKGSLFHGPCNNLDLALQYSTAPGTAVWLPSSGYIPSTAENLGLSPIAHPTPLDASLLSLQKRKGNLIT